MLNVVMLPDDRLHRPSSPVANMSDELIDYCDAMINTMHEHRGIGLAAVQTGRMETFFVVQVPDDKPQVFINPEIIAVSDTRVFGEEGCLSIPSVYADVERPHAVQIRAWNRRGKEFMLTAEGLLSRVIQHEYDHLEGKLFYEYLKPGQQKRLLRSYDRLHPSLTL